MSHVCGTKEGQIMCQEQQIKGLRGRRARGERTPELDVPRSQLSSLSQRTCPLPSSAATGLSDVLSAALACQDPHSP